jgi:predicted protein tyrosine phosphatase
MSHASLELIFSTSRAGAEAFSWNEPFAVISITDPDSVPATLRQPNIVARCDLQFWDLISDIGSGPIFNASMARTALEFARECCSGAKLLLIHCEAGISRSTGMADALGRILGVAVRHQNALMLNPNSLVMRLIFSEGGLALDGTHFEQFSAYRAALERRLRQDED